MQDLVKPGIAVAVIAAIGIGCYTWGQHKAVEPASSSPYPMATQTPAQTTTTTRTFVPSNVAPTAVGTMPSGSLVPAPATNSASLADPQVGMSTPVAPRTSLPGAQTMSQTTSTTTNTMPQSTVAPVATIPYAGTTTVTPVQNTDVEKKTTVTTKHVAYTQKTIHYKHHKPDKVHIARATKHGVMFALKLPGRAAF